MPINRQIRLMRRPQGKPRSDDFQLIETPVEPLAEGDVLVRHRGLSLDPYMRARMSDAKSYAPPQPLDAVMMGGTVGEIAESRNADFVVGAWVVGMGGWQEYQHVEASALGQLTRVTNGRIPPTAYLGMVGMPGMAAWYGVTQILAPVAGQSVIISSAAGAVGGVAGQLVKKSGGRAIGIAGGQKKCRYVMEELGFDACLDHSLFQGDRAALAASVAARCPEGLDGAFENVGGWILDAILPCMKPRGRVAICGLIAGYNGEAIPISWPQTILNQRLRLEGFIITDHQDLWPRSMRELVVLAATGKLTGRETVVDGLENAPSAFSDFMAGEGLGKWIVAL